MKRKMRLLTVCLLICLAVIQPAAASGRYGNVYGSCKKLSDRTVIMSIYASDTKTRWDWNNRDDYNRYEETYKRLGIAVHWIEDSARACGVRTDLIWDFYNVPYLYGEATFDQDMQTLDNADYYAYKRFIDEHISVEWLKSHFEAESIIFAFYYNSPMNSDVPSYTGCDQGSSLSEHEDYPDDPHYEICVLFTCGFGLVAEPATYAHELLHCFGGRDLYRADESINLSQQCSDWYRKNYPDELFMSNKIGRQDAVDFELTEVTKYYLGLIPSSQIVNQWGLKKSDYELIGY